MFSGVPKLGSACWRFERCFQLLCWRAQRSMVHQWLLRKDHCHDVAKTSYWKYLKNNYSHEHECTVMPAMLLICLRQYWGGKWKCCASRSAMNDVDDAKSNNALAMVVEPSEAITLTWLVLNITRQWLSLDCDVWDVMSAGVFFGEDGDALVCLWGLAFLLTWTQVW